ncbi:MAG: hypothetical protein ACOY82_05245 [Pseudomonadota bacterium]
MTGHFRRRGTETAADPRSDLLNEGLHLAMAWGEDWLQPIQERLAQRHPELSRRELDEIDAICRTAMRFGHDAVYDLALKSGVDTKREDFDPIVSTRYPWVNGRNLAQLFNQGMYYAWKDMGFA